MLVDAVRSALGLCKRYKENYDALVTARDAAISNNKMADTVVFKPLETALRNLLETLVAGESQRRASGATGSYSGPSVNPMSAATNASPTRACTSPKAVDEEWIPTLLMC